ncbi:checkpoint kinase, putative, partial [Ixodes scapularis]
DNIRISDFGLATVFRYKGEERPLVKKCGTLPYIAPEVLVKSYHAEPADVWSCGVILVALLAGELPWDKPATSCEQYKGWKECKITVSPWTKLDNMALSLVRKILTPNPTKRYTIEQIKGHQWTRKMFEAKSKKASCFDIGQTGDIARSVIQSVHFAVLSECYVWLYLDLQIIGDFLKLPSCLKFNCRVPYASCSALYSFRSSCLFESISRNWERPELASSSVTCVQRSACLCIFQSPLQKLVKRMTRFFVTTDANETVQELRSLFEKLGYVWKTNSPGQITVTTQDKRKAQLVFKANLIEMDARILVDFRLSRGDGLEFKKHFVTIRNRLSEHIAKGPVSWPIA